MAFCRKFFDGAVTTAIFISIRTFPFYIFFEIPIKFLYQFQTLSEVFWSFVESLQKMFFFEKKTFVFIRGPWAKRFSFLLKVFRRGCDNCNCFVHTNFSLIFFWNNKNFCISFKPWAKYFGLLSKNYRKCFFLKKNYVFIRGPWAIRFSLLSETAICVSKRLFLGEKKSFENFSFFSSFFDFEQTIFWHLSRFFRRCSQNCLLRVGTNNWTKNLLFMKKKLLWHIQILTKNILAFCQKMFGGFVTTK